MSAMNPTPQESFSCAGSNKPKPCAPIVVLALLARPRRACTARSRFGASLPAPPLLPSTHAQEGREGAPRANHIKEATFVPLAASGCLFRRRPTRPRPGGWPRTCLLPLSPSASQRGHGAHAWPKLGQQCCLCGTWQIPAANTRALSLLPAPTRRERRAGSKLSASALLRLGLPQCPAAASGPWRGALAQWHCRSRKPRFRGLRRPDELTRVIETKIGRRFEGKCPGLRRLSRRLATIRQPNGATTHQT